MSKLTLTCSAVDKSDNNIIDLFNAADVLPRCNIKATESIVNENGASLSPVGLSISNKLPFAELEDIDALIAEFGAVEEDTSEENRADASPNDKGSPDPKKLSENEMPADDDFEIVGFDEDLSDDP